MVCVIFSKKNRGDPGQTIKFFKKKMLGLYQNMEMRHRLAPNFTSSFS